MLSRLLRDLRGGPLAAVTAALFIALPAACANAREPRVGVAPKVPAGATLVATEASVRSMQITITLAPRDPVALRLYADGVSSPGNTDFRHFLTTAEFRTRFAPTRATVRGVERSLRAHGLKPGRLDASGLALTVKASSGALERAFKLTLSEVRLRDGRDAIFNAQAPALDRRIAGAVQAVLGLSTLYPAQGTALHGPSNPLLAARGRAASVRTRVATGGPQPCSQAVDDAPGSGGYTADQIASQYDFSPLYEAGDKGQGVTVALYELESDAPSDIAAYEKCYGIHTKITYVKVDGGAGSGAGSGEAALDIDQVISLAPKVKLLVYQGPNSNNGTGPYNTYAAIADQDKASVVSTSWGECEPEETLAQARAEATLFEQMAVQGQTLVAAAGDSGSEDCWIGGAGGDSNNSLQVDDPASQPFVTGVGGTSLEQGVFNLGGTGNPIYPTANPNETVWNNSYPGLQYATYGIAPGAGGGGISSFWQMPAYQLTAATAAPWLGVENTESSGANCAAVAGSYCREVPDVSADADPMDGYMTYWNGQGESRSNALSGWQSIGGTSAATPLWAAVFALAEASRACAGNLIGFPNPALYALASSSPTAYSSYFNDVTNDAINQGGDDNDLAASGNSAGLYEAGAGYDMATGLGTPNAANIAPALCREALQVQAAGVKQSFRGADVSARVSASLPAGQSGTVTYTAKHLPAGLRINRTTGVVSGKTTRTGVYDTVFGASLGGGDVGARSYLWTVARHPDASKLSLADTRTGRPLLAFTLSAGQNESALRSVLVKLPAGVSLRLPLHGGITVSGAAGRNVSHRFSIVHGNLLITFKPAHSPDKIVFSAGALNSQGRLLTSGVAPVTLVLHVVDREGASTTVTRELKPTQPAA